MSQAQKFKFLRRKFSIIKGIISWLFQMDTINLSLIVMLSLLTALILLMRWYRQYRLHHYEVPVYDFHRGHRFFMVDMFATPTYCNIDHTHIIHGAQCDSCGICVNDHRMIEANKRFA